MDKLNDCVMKYVVFPFLTTKNLKKLIKINNHYRDVVFDYCESYIKKSIESIQSNTIKVFYRGLLHYDFSIVFNIVMLFLTGSYIDNSDDDPDDYSEDDPDDYSEDDTDCDSFECSKYNSEEYSICGSKESIYNNELDNLKAIFESIYTTFHKIGITNLQIYHEDDILDVVEAIYDRYNRDNCNRDNYYRHSR